MVDQKEFEKLSSYIRMYVEKVIGLSYPVLDSPCPKTKTGDNPIVYLPMSFRSLSIFLGKEFIEAADKEIIFAIVIGLAYHEAAHLVSGEKITKPHILNNLICDSNDFNVVPQKWNGSIPFTLTLINTTYRQGMDLNEFELKSKNDKLQALIHMTITFLRKLRIKYKGKDARSLPKEHTLFKIFERIKPIVKEARKAKVEKRPELVKGLYKVLEKYWIEEEKKENSETGLSNDKKSFQDVLDDMSSEVKHELIAIDFEKLTQIMKGSKVLEKIKRELQDIINKARLEASLKEKKELKKALANISKYDRSRHYQIDGLKELSSQPVNVNDSIVNSLRKNLRLLFYERAIARRRASTVGVKFSPSRFHEIKTNPEHPRIRQAVVKMGKSSVETELVLCFDRSGSMGGEKEKVAQEIAGTLYKALSSIPRAKIEIVGFDDIPIIIAGKKKLPIDIVLRKIPAGLYARGGTNFPMGLRESLRILEKSTAHKKIVFMLTDGDLYGVPSVEELCRLAKSQNVEIFCIGVEGSDRTEIECLFGKKNSLYVDEINKLPEEVKKITINRL